MNLYDGRSPTSYLREIRKQLIKLHNQYNKIALEYRDSHIVDFIDTIPSYGIDSMAMDITVSIKSSIVNGTFEIVIILPKDFKTEQTRDVILNSIERITSDSFGKTIDRKNWHIETDILGEIKENVKSMFPDFMLLELLDREVIRINEC